MKRTARVVVVSVAAVIGLSQAASRAFPSAIADHGSQAVKPSTDTIRKAVDALLGWRVGIFTNAFPSLSFIESATLADALGLSYVGGDSAQRVSPDHDQNLDCHLSPEDIHYVKQKLASLKVKMTAYHVASIPSDRDSQQKLFDFAKELGAETIVTASAPASLADVDALATKIGMNIAIESRENPKELVSSIQNLSPHIGVSADFAQWMEHGTTPADGLAIVKDRLMAAKVRDRSSLGENAHDVPLGTGAADLQRFLYQVALDEPQPQEKPDACVNCSRPYGGTKPLFIALDVNPWEIVIATGPQPGTSGGTFADLWQAAADFEKAAQPAMGYRVDQDASLIPITSADRIPADVKEKIEAALPRQATVAPRAPRKLLVIDLCPAGGYYHDTVAHANFAIQKMADYTHAFEPTFSNDLNKLKYPDILKYDAVFLNSVVGEVFADPAVLDGLIRFVRQGGGVAGIHGSTYASQDMPEFGEMMGAQSGPHHVETSTLKVDDPDSPLTKQFASSPLTAQFGGKSFAYTDEFYHFLPTGPYSRTKLHVLISIDDAKTDLGPWHVRPDQDYGLVWVRSYGQGRVFNCALGHTPTFFETPALAQMVFNGIQFILGDLPVDTTPSAMLGSK